MEWAKKETQGAGMKGKKARRGEKGSGEVGSWNELLAQPDVVNGNKGDS